MYFWVILTVLEKSLLDRFIAGFVFEIDSSLELFEWKKVERKEENKSRGREGPFMGGRERAFGGVR